MDKIESTKIYGYVRISTAKQNVQRQVRNILQKYPDATIIIETFTGTKFYGRKELDKILKKVNPGDLIVFDSVSRMSRDAEEGFKLYEELYNKNVRLEFLKEPHINTDTYKEELNKLIQITIQTGDKDADLLMNSIIDALNRYTLSLAKKNIMLAFSQAEKEVQDLHQRTKEGIETARRAGKQIGRPANKKVITKKSILAKRILLEHSKTFGGALKNEDIMKLAGVSSMDTLLKYKRQLEIEIQDSSFEEVRKKYTSVL